MIAFELPLSRILNECALRKILCDDIILNLGHNWGILLNVVEAVLILLDKEHKAIEPGSEDISQSLVWILNAGKAPKE
jgi:hypothetical protein